MDDPPETGIGAAGGLFCNPGHPDGTARHQALKAGDPAYQDEAVWRAQCAGVAWGIWCRWCWRWLKRENS